VGKDSSGRPVIQLQNPAKVGRRWGTYLRYRSPAAAKISIKWGIKTSGRVSLNPNVLANLPQDCEAQTLNNQKIDAGFKTQKTAQPLRSS